jgi:hypothetical protein
MNKQIFIKIVFIGSVLLNLGFIGAIATHYFAERRNEKYCAKNSVEIPERNLMPWYKKTLNLNDEQFALFRGQNLIFRENAEIISQEMNVLRDSIFDESMNEIPDTTKIHRLSQKLGKYHAELKVLSTRYFINLMNVCDKNQKQQLYHIFYSMQNAQNDMKCNMRKGPRFGGGGKHRNFETNN